MNYLRLFPTNVSEIALALEQVRITRSQEYLDTDHNRPHGDAVVLAAQQRTVSDYLKSASVEQGASQYRPPPPYPNQFIPPQVPQNSSIDETPEPHLQPSENSPPNPSRGPPPPYHTPSPSVVGQGNQPSG